MNSCLTTPLLLKRGKLLILKEKWKSSLMSLKEFKGDVDKFVKTEKRENVKKRILGKID